MLNKDRVNLRKKASRSYFIGLTVVISGLLLFLTSGFYIEEELEVLASPVGEEIRITSATNIEVVEWIYDEEKNEMEVIIDLNEYEKELNDMEFIATQRSDLSQVNVEMMLEYEQYIVLKISEFDRDYTQISLRLMIENESDIEENEALSEENKVEKRNLVTLYTDYREVDHGTVKVEEEPESRAYISVLLIEQSEDKIELLEEDITVKEEEINEINQQIESLEQEKQYQTDEEKVQTDNRINALEIEKNELKTEQDRAREQISIEEERIQNLIQRERDSSLSYS